MASRATTIVAGQLVRAATSSVANIAEGYGRHRGKEYEMAYGSANEVDNWLSVACDAGLLDAGVAAELQRGNKEVQRILATIIRKLVE